MCIKWVVVIFISLILSGSLVSANCIYADSVSATNQNEESLAGFTLGTPDAPNQEDCSVWSGYGYTWSPSDWDKKATLTLHYKNPVKADYLQVFGDYDICWRKIWVENSKSHQSALVFNGFNSDCTLTHTFNVPFEVDTIKLETCGWGWTATDAVALCGDNVVGDIICGNGILEGQEECDDGNTYNGDGCSSDCKSEPKDIEVCTWQNCQKGAASISIDDSYPSCKEKLEANNFSGTYFLLGTKDFTSEDWDFWNQMYHEGHELGAHTQNHYCKPVDDSTLHFELRSNVNDILDNTDITPTELTSFAWPCGFNTKKERDIASEYFISARGYHINQLEKENPSDFMNLRSLNTPYYHDESLDPPEYKKMADKAEEEGMWVNYIFHNHCKDDGAISYLSEKDIWVAPIGDVTKYIKERQNIRIKNLDSDDDKLSFNVLSELDPKIFNEKITMKVESDENPKLKINGKTNRFIRIDEDNIMFNFIPTGNDKIELTNSEDENCIDKDNDEYYAISKECNLGNDCNDNNKNIHPNANEKVCNGIDNDCDKRIDEDYISYTCGVGECEKNSRCVDGKESCTPGQPSKELCNDGLDNDCDGKTDLEDTDCKPNTNQCHYPISASATSQDSNHLASYATGKPDAEHTGDCSKKSEDSHTWSPVSKNTRAILTLRYEKPIEASTFTIHGDYDMCWSKIWMENSQTHLSTLVFDGTENSCSYTQNVNVPFKVDTIKLETCGTSGSYTDTVKLCAPSTSVCGNGILEGQEECDDGNDKDGDGCSASCELESKTDVYLAPYIGDIDHHIDEGWYYFYEKISSWHTKNQIPASVSFYDIQNSSDAFMQVFRKMYESDYIELVLKGEAHAKQKQIDELSYDEVKNYFETVQNHYSKEMLDQGYSNAKLPLAYNQLQARFTETIRDAAHDVGMKIYFDQYASELGYVEPLSDFDVIQYSVAMTNEDLPGPDSTFKEPDKVIEEILDFKHEEMVFVDGIKVVPLLTHQQDFRESYDSDELNSEKWNTYKRVLLSAKDNPKIEFITPTEIYSKRHK